MAQSLVPDLEPISTVSVARSSCRADATHYIITEAGMLPSQQITNALFPSDPTMPSTMRKKRKTKSSWEHVALEAQCARDQSIRDVGFNITLPAKLPGNVTDLPKTLLSGVQLNITSLSIEEVVQLAGKGDISVRDIVHAFMCRAVVAQQSVRPQLLFEFCSFIC